MMDYDPPTKKYFHGTKAPLVVGDELRPRCEHGGLPTNAPLVPGGQRYVAADDFAYVTSRYYLAWAYAHKSGGDGPPIVLTVRPADDLEVDPEHSAAACAFRCSSALVVSVDDVPPISADLAARLWK